MSAAPEIIAQLAGGSSWKTERLDRGAPTLTEEDLAGALGGLGDGPVEVMLVKYAGYPPGPLEAVLCREICAMMGPARWFREHALYRRMASLAVHEVVHAASCRLCLGKGSAVVEDSGYSVCPLCTGSGLGSLSWWERETILGRIGRADRNDYDRIYALVQAWESEGIGHLARRLFGEFGE